MRAATYETTGASDVLTVRDVEAPEPGPNQVRVRLAVSGVNPTDWKSRSGATGGVAEGAAFQIPNQDGAGTIDAVGPGVDEGRIGERVWVHMAAAGSPWGTAAQQTVVPADRAVALGDASFDLGASLGVPAITAHRALFADGGIEGAGVLVAGGAGAVGQMAIQLACLAGARVCATVSSEEKAAIARDAGAHATVNYRDADAADRVRAALPGGADRVVEVDLAANLALDLAVLNNDGAIVTYADPGTVPELPAVRALMTDNVVLRFMLLYTVPPTALNAAAADITSALAADALKPLPLHRFGLEETAAAHDAVEAGAVGKVLIDIP